MSRETRHLLLKPLAGLVAIAFVAGLSLVDSAAAPASSGAAAKVVTISLSDRGKGTWSMAGDTEKGSLSLSYNWTGVVTLDVPATQLRNPTRGRLSARGTAVLKGSWSGDYSGTRFAGQPNAGPYHCTYTGRNVTIRVSATLRNGPSSKVIYIVLTRSKGFFPPKGSGAEVSCANPVGEEGPPHFEPEWLFRDNVSDHYRLSATTAYIVLPRTILTGGSATTTFPREIGSAEVSLGPKIDWHNVGRLVAKKR